MSLPWYVWFFMGFFTSMALTIIGGLVLRWLMFRGGKLGMQVEQATNVVANDMDTAMGMKK